MDAPHILDNFVSTLLFSHMIRLIKIPGPVPHSALGPAKTASLLLVLVAATNERAAAPLSIQLRGSPTTSSVPGPSRGHRGTEEMEWIQRNYTHKINVCCRDEGVKRKFLNWIGFDNDVKAATQNQRSFINSIRRSHHMKILLKQAKADKMHNVNMYLLNV